MTIGSKEIDMGCRTPDETMNSIQSPNEMSRATHHESLLCKYAISCSNVNVIRSVTLPLPSKQTPRPLNKTLRVQVNRSLSANYCGLDTHPTMTLLTLLPAFLL